jgi:hypothetical protein
MAHSEHRPVGHLSPDLNGPVCGATGKVRLHRPGVTKLCVQCVCMLEEPSSGRILAKQIRNREWREAWLAWATGGGGPYPHYRDYYVPGQTERPDPNPSINSTTDNSMVTFKRV